MTFLIFPKWCLSFLNTYHPFVYFQWFLLYIKGLGAYWAFENFKHPFNNHYPKDFNSINGGQGGISKLKKRVCYVSSSLPHPKRSKTILTPYFSGNTDKSYKYTFSRAFWRPLHMHRFQKKIYTKKLNFKFYFLQTLWNSW